MHNNDWFLQGGGHSFVDALHWISSNPISTKNQVLVLSYWFEPCGRALFLVCDKNFCGAQQLHVAHAYFIVADVRYPKSCIQNLRFTNNTLISACTNSSHLQRPIPTTKNHINGHLFQHSVHHDVFVV
jgi:hypothetical protein